jgi:hypothetical protein
MLQFLHGRLTQRKVRLFACACCRLLWPVLTNQEVRTGISSAEEFADDSHDWSRMGDAHAFLGNLGEDTQERVRMALWIGDLESTANRYWGSRDPEGSSPGDYIAEAALCRDIFGNPFCPWPALPSNVLDWSGGTVRRIAQAIYDERQLPSGHLDSTRLAVLADALEDAGCTDAAILVHLRGPGPHVRGCWAVDQILERE